MSRHEVEAVWVFKYTMANFKATYGRLPRSTEYTKDYLQISEASNCYKEFQRITGRTLSPGEEGESVTFRWPGGEAPGRIEISGGRLQPGRTEPSGSRLHLVWGYDAPPPPWRLHPNIGADSLWTFEGNPDLSTGAEANTEWEHFKAKDQDPWLVVVKLRGEDRILHLRAYLGNPPSHLQHCAKDQLPALVKNAMASVRGNAACGALSLPALDPDVGRLISTLELNPNVLLVGPPGTGKTVLLERLAALVESGKDVIWFDPERNHDAFSELRLANGMTRTVVFHPSYTYENLVLGLLPTSGPGGGVGVRVTPGPLVNLAHYASGTGARALLVLDEFNRGNAAAILGDFLALLDADKRHDPEHEQVGATVDLPYGDMTITVPSDFAVNGNTTVDPRFSLPKSLWIVAAMNSSDRSVAPLDAALRRRFSIIHMPPDYEVLRAQIGAPMSVDFPEAGEEWSIEQLLRLVVLLLERLNERLESVIGADFLLGQSNFWHVEGDSRDEAVASFARAVDERVVPTLRMMFTDNDDGLATVLRAGSREEASLKVDPNRVCYWWKPTDDLGAFAYERLRFNALSKMATSTAIAELRRLAGA